MKKFLPYIALAVLAYWFLKKKDANAGTTSGTSTAGGQDIFDQLSGGLSQLLGNGKQNTTGIAAPSTGKAPIIIGAGSGTGASLSGASINVGPALKALADTMKQAGKTISNWFHAGPSAADKSFAEDNYALSSPITQPEAKAAKAALDAESASFNFDSSPSGYDYNPDPWEGNGSFADFNV